MFPDMLAERDLRLELQQQLHKEPNHSLWNTWSLHILAGLHRFLHNECQLPPIPPIAGPVILGAEH